MAEDLLPADDGRTLLAAADAARARGAQRLATDLARQALALADTQAPPSAGDADLPALLEGVRQTWLPVAQARGLVLDLHADPALPGPLPVDGPRLGQILEALVDNAIKLTSQGRVRLQAAWAWGWRWPSAWPRAWAGRSVSTTMRRTAAPSGSACRCLTGRQLLLTESQALTEIHAFPPVKCL